MRPRRAATNGTVTPAMRPIWSELEVELDEVVGLEVELGPSVDISLSDGSSLRDTVTGDENSPPPTDVTA